MLSWPVATLMPLFSGQLRATARLLWITCECHVPRGPLCCQGRNTVGLSLFPLQIPVNEVSQCAGKMGSFIPADSVQDSSWNGNFSILTPIVSIFSPDLERPSFLGLSCDSDSLLTEQRLPTVPNHSWLEVGESLKNNTPRQTQWVWSISWKLYLTPFWWLKEKLKQTTLAPSKITLPVSGGREETGKVLLF